jgi:hypothetical protein
MLFLYSGDGAQVPGSSIVYAARFHLEAMWPTSGELFQELGVHSASVAHFKLADQVMGC